jgi:hypothetical protein
VVNNFAIFENSAFLHSLGREQKYKGTGVNDRGCGIPEVHSSPGNVLSWPIIAD